MKRIKRSFITVVIKTAVGGLNLAYFFIKLFPTSKKITFISRLGNQPSFDFQLILKEVEARSLAIKTVVLCKKLNSGLKAKILYLPHLFRQMYHIATSKAVVLDSYCIPISLLKQKKDLTVVQMWHGLGSFKKFGFSILDKKEAKTEHVKGLTARQVAELMRMHKGYSYILASNPQSAVHFSEAFGYPVEKFKIISLPRVDFLSDKDAMEELAYEIIGQNPWLSEKKNILYVPTFRRQEHFG